MRRANLRYIFLDLSISIGVDGFITSTFFKNTDRNSFIPVDSCHHASWLKSVPKSQYLRLKHNCTNQTTFLEQAQILTQRFVEKGYSMQSLGTTLDVVNNTNRVDLLRENTDGGKKKYSFKNPFITNYSC